MPSTRERIDEDFKAKLIELFRAHGVKSKDLVYLMPASYYWREVGEAAISVGAIPHFVDLDGRTLGIIHRRFNDSVCIKCDITKPLDPLPSKKIHFVFLRDPGYIFRPLIQTFGKSQSIAYMPGGIIGALNAHKRYVDKVFVADTMTRDAVKNLPKIPSIPLAFAETVRLLRGCGYEIIEISPYRANSGIMTNIKRFIVAKPK